jgi:hypothetical protein
MGEKPRAAWRIFGRNQEADNVYMYKYQKGESEFPIFGC